MVTKIPSLSRFALLGLVIVLSSFTASGCVMRGDGKGIAYAADGAAIATGLLLANADNGCSDGDSLCDLASLPAEAAMKTLGTTLLLAGTIGLIANYAVNQHEPESRPLPPGYELSFQSAAPHSVLTPPGQTPAFVGRATSSAPVAAPTPQECQSPVQEWRAEANHQTRYDLLRAMSITCRQAAVAG